MFGSHTETLTKTSLCNEIKSCLFLKCHVYYRFLSISLLNIHELHASHLNICCTFKVEIGRRHTYTSLPLDDTIDSMPRDRCRSQLVLQFFQVCHRQREGHVCLKKSSPTKWQHSTWNRERKLPELLSSEEQ